MIGAQGEDGGNEADDESQRKMKTNKQRRLGNQMYLRGKSLQIDSVLRVMTWKLLLLGTCTMCTAYISMAKKKIKDASVSLSVPYYFLFSFQTMCAKTPGIQPFVMSQKGTDASPVSVTTPKALRLSLLESRSSRSIRFSGKLTPGMLTAGCKQRAN